jgi:hypothetical protein
MGLDFSSLCGDGAKPGVELPVFSDPKPTDEEKEVFDEIRSFVENEETGQAKVLKNLTDYGGCQDIIRKAITDPGPETALEAFEALLPAVASIKSFHDYSLGLDSVLKKLIEQLANAQERDPSPGCLTSNAALSVELVGVLAFVLEFDSTRQTRPNLSNDFSYYRRLAPKHQKHPDIVVKDEAAGTMSMFIAQHIPMLKTAIKAAQSIADMGAQQHVTGLLALVSNSLLHMLRSGLFDGDEQKLKLMRGMTGAVLVFDHVDSLGVFRRSSGVACKSVIQFLKREGPPELLNAIHYSSKTFENAPGRIQALFE